MSNLKTVLRSTGRDRRLRSNSNASSRQLTIQNSPIDSIRLDPLNPRAHSDEQVQQIARSIRCLRFNVPILIDQERKVIAGNGRLLACKLLGVAEVPTISLGHLSPHQAAAFAMADNKVSENSTWNEALLGEQLKALSGVELDFNLEATGFEMAEIDLVIEGLSPSLTSAQDPADVVPENPGLRGEQVYRPGGEARNVRAHLQLARRGGRS